ncbi:helix-hairpin-helix domain-containing protein [Streptomyces sp. NPDC058892]|uniref:helix-hairpin-helix domain-containing protein n=1 Tax=unclassified Streptomyces TaxID=2593676 RepID=UPI0036813D17
MTLRTRIAYPSGATSGPGRTRLSDSRLRRGGGGGRRRNGLRGAPARPRRGPHPGPDEGSGPDPGPDALRRRAEALLGGAGPPEPAVSQPSPLQPLLPSPSAAEDPPAPSGGAVAGALTAGAARRLAVRERLPVWLQARCAVEPRSVAAVGVVLVAAVCFAAQQYWSARPQDVTAPAPAVLPAVAAAPAAAGGGGGAGPAGTVVVDVGGKVRDPGVRRLPAGSRVEDALAAAGGVRPGTDTTGLNRARVLVDGEQVLVGATAPPGTAAGGPAAGPLSLGSATVEQLDALPGVGPVLAQHIVDFRTARGGFRSVEELRQVNGIGERRFADLRTLVRP